MSFHDSMIDEGYSDEMEYMDHLLDEFEKSQSYIESYDDDICDEYDDNDEDIDELNEKELKEIISFFRKWLKNNPNERDKFFICYHYMFDYVNYMNLDNLHNRWTPKYYDELCSGSYDKYLKESYLEWAEEHKLENFFSGIMFEHVEDSIAPCFDDNGSFKDMVYDSSNVNRQREISWSLWMDDNDKFHKWLDSLSIRERKDFYNGVNNNIRNEKGLFFSMLQYYVEVKEQMFFEECFYMLTYILKNIHKAFKIFYEKKCFDYYNNRDENPFNI